MSKEQLLMRFLCAESMVDAHKVRTGYLAKEDYSRLIDGLAAVSRAPLHIDDSSTLTVMEMRAKARRLKAEHGLSLIIVDYLQLMSGYGRVENRVQEISGISRGLKALAKELNVPVIALSQLSRAPEQRQGDHRPQLSDLRESGSIEQDADRCRVHLPRRSLQARRREFRQSRTDHCETAQWSHRCRKDCLPQAIYQVRKSSRRLLTVEGKDAVRLPELRPQLSQVDRPLSVVSGMEYLC